MIGERGGKPHLAALIILALSFALPAYARGASGAHDGALIVSNNSAAHHASGAGMVRRWNGIAIDASGLDHTPVTPGENRVFGEQFGPTRASRAMAILHIAMFDAINSIGGGYHSYTGIHPAPAASMDAAIVQAAHDTLVALFPWSLSFLRRHRSSTRCSPTI